jgi:Tfp pilus assembly protein PilN
VNPVNLLPTKHRPRTPTGGQQGSAYIVVGVLGVLLVMVVFYVLTINGVNSRKDQVTHAKGETADAQARATALGPYGDFSKIKQDRVNSVKQLAGGRIDWERLARGLARVLPNDVWLTSASASASGTPAAAGSGGTAPSGGATAATTASAGPKVQLIGCAASHSAVAVTLVRLRELSGAQDVQLNQITRAEPGPKSSGSNPSPAAGGSGGSGNGSDCGVLHGQPLAKWDATVSFNQNVGSSATGVPSTLGGGA